MNAITGFTKLEAALAHLRPFTGELASMGERRFTITTGGAQDKRAALAALKLALGDLSVARNAVDGATSGNLITPLEDAITGLSQLHGQIEFGLPEGRSASYDLNRSGVGNNLTTARSNLQHAAEQTSAANVRQLALSGALNHRD